MKQEPLPVIIDKMFEFANCELRYKDVVGRTDDWYEQNTMTQQQYEEWRDWAVAYLRKNLRMPKYKAIKEFNWLNLYCGLKIRT